MPLSFVSARKAVLEELFFSLDQNAVEAVLAAGWSVLPLAERLVRSALAQCMLAEVTISTVSPLFSRTGLQQGSLR